MSSTTLLGPTLTAEESEILHHLAHGLIGVTISRRMGFGPNGARTRLVAIYEVLGVRSAARAIVRGHQLGILDSEPVMVEGLSAGELDLLRMLEAGWTNRQIAAHHRVALTTVNSWMRGLYVRLGATNRPNAVHRGWCAGLLGGAA